MQSWINYKQIVYQNQAKKGKEIEIPTRKMHRAKEAAR